VEVQSLLVTADGSRLFIDMMYLFSYTVSCARIQATFIANGVKMLHL